MVLKESMETAVERTIETMMDWGEEKEAPGMIILDMQH